MVQAIRICYVSCFILLCAQVCYCSSTTPRGNNVEKKGRRIWKMSQITQALSKKQDTHDDDAESSLKQFSVPIKRLEKQRDNHLVRRLRLPLVPTRPNKRRSFQDRLTRREKQKKKSLNRKFRYPSVSTSRKDRNKDVQEEEDDKKSSGLRMHGFMSIYQNRRRRRYDRNRGLIYG